MNGNTDDPNDIVRHLNRRRARARAVLLFERLWPALWPPLALVGLFLIAALLDLPRLLPPTLHLLLLIMVFVALIGLLTRALRGLRRPDDQDADRRLEQASGLRHRPLAVLSDRPASADAATLALWRAHAARAAGQIRRLRVGLPHPGLPARDPRALRGALVVALVAAIGIAGGDAPARLAYALRPAMPPPPPAVPGQVQAWITPPAYTGLPPLFLKDSGGAVSVPAGSHLTVNLTGGTGEPSLLIGGRTEPFQALDSASFQVERALDAGGPVIVRQRGKDLAAWDITTVADLPPTVSFPEQPGQAAHSAQVRLPWQTAHEYGVVALQAELHLRDRPAAPAVLVTIPLPGGRTKSAHGVQQTDLTAHPWAGLPVTARLLARDAAGQQGNSDTVTLTLPERAFHHPLARALVALRRTLTLAPDVRRPVADSLDILAEQPAMFEGELSTLLTLRATGFLLRRERSEQAVDEAQARMWALALHLEDNGPERTARALEAARQAARDAVARAAQDKTPEHLSAHQAEVERKLQELRDAIQKHLQALLEQQRRGENDPARDRQAREAQHQNLDALAEQARDAAREGRMEDARQKLAELEKLLDQLKNAEAGRPGGQDDQNAAQRQRGQQQLGALQDLVRRQGGVLDHAQARGDAAENAPPGDPTEGATPPDPTLPAPDAKPDQGAAQRSGDKRVQQALRRALGELMQRFGDLTGSVPQSLSDADTAMRDAATALGAGDDAQAGRHAQRAIEALQKGGKDMRQQMAQRFGAGQKGDEAAQGDEDGGNDPDGQDGNQQGGRGRRGTAQGPLQHGHRDASRDPLGRYLHEGAAGMDEGTDVAVPDQMEEQRTRAIQDELRRRGAERGRPQPELDYIDRLLKQF